MIFTAVAGWVLEGQAITAQGPHPRLAQYPPMRFRFEGLNVMAWAPLGGHLHVRHGAQGLRSIRARVPAIRFDRRPLGKHRNR